MHRRRLFASGIPQRSSARSLAGAAAQARRKLRFLAFLLVAIMGAPCWAATNGSGSYQLRLDKPEQVIQGLGVEIQSDSIGSGNSGLPDEVIAVPHDLTPSERARFYAEMLRGFRYVRLAMGLYLRGTDASQKHIVERYAGQMDDLRELQQASGIEGFDVEYWSPAPYWKEQRTYFGGTLAAHDDEFIAEFTDALVADAAYLKAHGLRIVQWGLQNEPGVSHPAARKTGASGDSAQAYSTCWYSVNDYVRVLASVAPKIKALLPHVEIHVSSWDGQAGPYGAAVHANPELLSRVDSWSWHQVGSNSNRQIEQRSRLTEDAMGKPVFSNEFEYQPWVKPDFDSYFMNTGQSIMNWMVFESSPTWYWLHALKPETNLEAESYALGIWRPQTGPARPGSPLLPGHWRYEDRNWNAISGFVKYLGWDAQRYAVDEDVVRRDQRIMAWRRKDGRMVIALSNRGPGPFRFRIRGLTRGAYEGHRYTESSADVSLPTRGGKGVFVRTVECGSFEFWVSSARVASSQAHRVRRSLPNG